MRGLLFLTVRFMWWGGLPNHFCLYGKQFQLSISTIQIRRFGVSYRKCQPRGGALGVTVYQDRLYAIGGYDGERNTAAVEVFDPQTNTWSSAASMPTLRDHLAVVTAGSRIYAIGGRPNLDYSNNMKVVEEYDPESNQWQSRAKLPTARSGIAAGVIEGRIYVLGGESEKGTYATNEMYIPESDQWQAMTPMPTARHGLGAAVVDGRLYVISGGPTPGGSFSQINEIFTPPAFSY